MLPGMRPQVWACFRPLPLSPVQSQVLFAPRGSRNAPRTAFGLRSPRHQVNGRRLTSLFLILRLPSHHRMISCAPSTTIDLHPRMRPSTWLAAGIAA